MEGITRSFCPAFGKGPELNVCIAQTSTYFIFAQESF